MLYPLSYEGADGEATDGRIRVRWRSGLLLSHYSVFGGFVGAGWGTRTAQLRREVMVEQGGSGFDRSTDGPTIMAVVATVQRVSSIGGCCSWGPRARGDRRRQPAAQPTWPRRSLRSCNPRQRRRTLPYRSCKRRRRSRTWRSPRMPPPSSCPSSRRNAAIVQFAETTMQHHTDHAAEFNARIEALGGAPAGRTQPALRRNRRRGTSRRWTDAVAVLDMVAILESAATDTYLADLTLLTDPALRSLSASVMGVEAQHLATARMFRDLIVGRHSAARRHPDRRSVAAA